jgi:polysaccharide biosynthesis transport protein
MDNSENKRKRKTRPKEENPQANPDSQTQSGQSSYPPLEEKKRTEITHAISRPVDANLSSSASFNPPGPAQPILSATDIIQSALRHKWIMLIIFVIVSAVALPLIWTQIVPKYQAIAQVRIRPIIPYLVFKTEDNGAIPLYDSYVQTQCTFFKTDTVLQRVLDLPEIQKTQWYTNPPKTFLQRMTGNHLIALARLKESLSAKPLTGTEIINVTFTDTSPKDAQLMANAVVEQYMNYALQTSDATKDKLYKQLVEEYQTLEKEIQGRETVISELRQRLGTATPEELISGQRVRLDEAQAHLAEVQQNIKILDWEIEQVKSADSNDTLATLDENTMKQLVYFQDTEWCRLDVNVKTLRHTNATSLLNPKNPDAIRAVEELAFAEELLKKRQDQLDLQWPYKQKNLTGLTASADTTAQDHQKNLALLQYQLGKAKYQEQLINADIKTQQTSFDELFNSAQLLEKENSTLQNKRDLFDAVRQRLEQKNIESNVPGSIELLAQAAIPSAPYNDRRIQLSVMMFVFALGIGAAGAFLKDRTNTVVHAFKDLPYPMQVPFLGYIPAIDNTNSPTSKAGQNLTEAIRIMRTTLLSRLDGEGGTTILVTSSGAATGKTGFTMMLSKSLAQAGKKVLMIDTDFHKMALSGQFENLPEHFGLIQALGTSALYDQHVFQTWIPGLYFVPAGKREDNVIPEEIANGAFRNFIGKMRTQYDVILLDSAPILPLADSAILSSQVDGTIMVERELVSRRADTIAALARLGAAGGRLFGTVIIGSENN